MVVKLPTNWDKLPTSTGAGFLSTNSVNGSRGLVIYFLGCIYLWMNVLWISVKMIFWRIFLEDAMWAGQPSTIHSITAKHSSPRYIWKLDLLLASTDSTGVFWLLDKLASDGTPNMGPFSTNCAGALAYHPSQCLVSRPSYQTHGYLWVGRERWTELTELPQGFDSSPFYQLFDDVDNWISELWI